MGQKEYRYDNIVDELTKKSYNYIREAVLNGCLYLYAEVTPKQNLTGQGVAY